MSQQSLIIPPSGFWEGNDGAWSTFAVDIGTPARKYRLLPSTGTSQLWAPKFPEACQNILSDLAKCKMLRGADASVGKIDDSSSWNSLEIYDLPDGLHLFDSGQAVYGTDLVSVNSTTGSFGLQNQLLAAYNTPEAWLGLLGLNSNSTSLSNRQYKSLITSWRDDNRIQRLAFGYTAGAAYASPKVPGALTVGAYELSRLDSGYITAYTDIDTSILRLSLREIWVSDSLNGTKSLLPNRNQYFQIDTATSQMWLPREACDQFENAFGLIFDNTTGYYLLNDSTHEALLQRSPSVTLTLGRGALDGGDTTEIRLPYSAFDLNISLPYYKDQRRYFPIRRAANESQYVLGRVLLQEAYLAVDWEAGNFTIGKVVHQQPDQSSQQPEVVTDEVQTGGSSNKAVIGGVVAGVLVLLALGLAFGWWYWRRRHRKPQEEEHAPPEVLPSPKEAESAEEKHRRSTIGSQGGPDGYGTLPPYEPKPMDEITEMAAPHGDTQLMSNEIFEMQGEGSPRELRSAEAIRNSLEATKSKGTTVSVQEIT